ncbi:MULTISPECIES: hypothetical protein [Brachyspira]|uniref:hypothetical protein n=1 Tax=Brachyspira TaxID=29521 RepID=UPI0012F47C4A|nr:MULTISPECIES: hypothetical protein [Brachyspira]
MKFIVIFISIIFFISCSNNAAENNDYIQVENTSDLYGLWINEETDLGYYFAEDGKWKTMVSSSNDSVSTTNSYYVENGLLYNISSKTGETNLVDPNERPLLMSKDKTKLYLYGDTNMTFTKQ